MATEDMGATEGQVNLAGAQITTEFLGLWMKRAMKPMSWCAAALVIFPPYADAAEQWRGSVVAPEERCAPYDASEYLYPQSVEPRIAASLGGVYSPYTCETFSAIHETAIEHIVARSEAHDSGLCAASPPSASTSLSATYAI